MSRSDVLVDADWVQAHLDDPGTVLVEVDEDTSAYDKGHLPGAVRIDWKADLQDPVRRDFVGKAQFEVLLSAKGIGNDDTVILYGGNNNWFAAYAYWYFKLYAGAGVDLAKDTIAYCRIGERSAHTWFVLHELLGQPNVRNYDGSWTEYGSLVGVPVQLGDEPGGPEGGA